MTTSEPGVAEPLRQAVFERFVRDVEPRLRRALVAAYGGQRGREATAEALSWAWENWDRVRAMTYPHRYLFRVGRSRTPLLRRSRRGAPLDRHLAPLSETAADAVGDLVVGPVGNEPTTHRSPVPPVVEGAETGVGPLVPGRRDRSFVRSTR
jgi:DNA-directed RNA polymerase specialized sigma24 family protein